MGTRRDGIAEVRAAEAVFHALAHASRRQILVVLHARGDRLSAGEIARRFSCSWPTTSRHLKVLQDAGLIRAEKEGRERFYRLQGEHLRATAGAWIDRVAGRRR